MAWIILGSSKPSRSALQGILLCIVEAKKFLSFDGPSLPGKVERVKYCADLR